MLGAMGRVGRNRGASKRRPASYYRVAGVDLRTEMDRLAHFPSSEEGTGRSGDALPP